MAKKAKQSTSSKKKKSEKQPHHLRAYLRELRPTWKKNPDFVIPMMEDMLEKKAKFLIDKITILEFVQRFMLIHESRIQKVKPEIYDDVLSWVFLSRLQSHADFYNWVRKKKYEQKFWLTDQFQLDYLNTQIKERTEKLFHPNPADKRESRLHDILLCFKDGEFPDLEKYSLIEVGIVVGDIEFIEYLESERDELLQTMTETTAKVPVEFKMAEESRLHELIVQIPGQFFEKLAQKQTDESNAQISPASKRIPEPKLYTREQTSELMNVSISTVDNLTKDGTLKCHRIGNTSMKRYKWEDIDNALEVMEMRVNKRFQSGA